MTINEMIGKLAYFKALNAFLAMAEKTVEGFIDYDCEHNLMTREQFNALLKLSSAIHDADLELI